MKTTNHIIHIIFSNRLFILIILPVLLTLVSVNYINQFKLAFTGDADPEYIHLVSSVNISEGEFRIQSIQNPATPLYVLGACVVKITNWFTTSKTIKEDLILNPEKYIMTFRIALVALTSIVLLITGLIIYKKTENISVALMFQFCPFISKDILISSSIINPEHMLIIIGLLYAALIISYLNKSENENDYKYIFYFSIINALGCATKITFIPLIIIPLFAIKGIMNKVIYFIMTIILFFVFAFPVTLQLQSFNSWVKGLIFQGGLYGRGNQQIISIHGFLRNISSILNTEMIYAVVFISLLITVCLYNIIRFKLKQKKDLEYRFVFGIIIAYIIGLIMVTKQYADRYLTQSILLTSISIYLIINIWLKNNPLREKSIIRIIVIPFIILYLLFNYKYLYLINDHFQSFKKSRMDAYNFIERNLKNKPMLIVPNYFGSATKEYALLFGVGGWMGRYKDNYIELVKENYKEKYFYIPWENKYINWTNDISLYDILKNHPVLYIYVSLDATEKTEEDFANEMIDRINSFNKGTDKRITELQTIYKSQYDMVSRISVDTLLLKKLYNQNFPSNPT